MPVNASTQDSSLAASTPVTAIEIMTALERILGSGAFAAVERPSRFLRHIVEGALNGQTTALKESLMIRECSGSGSPWLGHRSGITRKLSNGWKNPLTSTNSRRSTWR